MSGISDTDMQTLTEAAFAFEDISGYSPEESLRAANSLMNQFGVTAEEAYNLMVQGQQQGLDFSGELLDSINEYAPQFEKWGFRRRICLTYSKAERRVVRSILIK